MTYKSGFVALIGRPNVGKSTLMNTLIGEKISIITPLPQTTQKAIRGILTTPKMQVVFVDTPGIHREHTKLGKMMNESAIQAIKGVDLILFIIDVSHLQNEENQALLEQIFTEKIPVILILNKVDLVSKAQVLEVLLYWQKQFNFNEFIPISAKGNVNLAPVLDVLEQYLPEGPQLYPSGESRDMAVDFYVAELIREKIMLLTREEIPHSVGVVIEKMKQHDNQKMSIGALIFVERDSQKGIIIGEKGSRLRMILESATPEIEKLLKRKIHLEAFVKVEKDWRNNPRYLKNLGFQIEKE